MPDNPTTALVKSAQSPALARVSNQLALTDKLLTRPEEPFLIPYRKGNKWGFCDRNKNIVIDCVYDWAWQFHEDRAWVEKEKHWGIIDLKGKELSFYNINEHQFTSFSGGFCRITYSYQLDIVLDKQGNKHIASEKYRYIGPFLNGLAVVKNINNIYGFINTRGEEIIPCQYDDVGSFSEECAAVREGPKWTYVDQFGQEVIKDCFDYAEDFSDGLARVWKDGKWFFIDKSGQRIFQVCNDIVSSFSDGLALIKNNGRWNYIDKKGEVLMSFNYDEAGIFHEGLAYVIANEKLGYISIHGEEVIPLKYSHNIKCNFNNGITTVAPDDRPWGYIDKKGVEYWED